MFLNEIRGLRRVSRWLEKAFLAKNRLLSLDFKLKILTLQHIGVDLEYFVLWKIIANSIRCNDQWSLIILEATRLTHQTILAKLKAAARTVESLVSLSLSLQI